ncbi:MAG: [FeFe] hydrogenase H-cluster radical SAM maturase HydE [Bacteroidales bacterium]|nr:[FeFe] hydrogenase H-cluster radical SAM maturase HydE [Bacteroidales bacterium]MDD4217077.1 [FeFe] hydrogenase H-cluster radical SAM maturase HydE [Bacteroidales bacterium]MDY0142482.1 [FeFe] hydrogenase H-cluster radical SAM maturase HydE [Bacteroidales bacterium]
MQNKIISILNQKNLNREDLILLLSANASETELIYKKAAEIKSKHIGNFTYFRGLIELSNVCTKNCYYCGIRSGNKKAKRYTVTDDEVLRVVRYALDRNWGSIVIQAGERQDDIFIDRIEGLLKKIQALSSEKVGITLSLGEQKIETYDKWLEAGATRYLVRVETSNEDLFYKIHPKDKLHDFELRKQALIDLQKAGYITGTGVMIGLPFQTMGDLADDLLFMQEYDIDMVGMGPYIEHEDTPLYRYNDVLLPVDERFNLTLKMIAVLRILMKDVNIASATALQAINPLGREEGIRCGANVIMPNITPVKYHEAYNLYKGKPQIVAETDEYIKQLETQINEAGDVVGYGELGDPLHFKNRTGS